MEQNYSRDVISHLTASENRLDSLAREMILRPTLAVEGWRAGPYAAGRVSQAPPPDQLAPVSHARCCPARVPPARGTHLPLGTPAAVRAEVRERVRVLGKGGGYICGSDHSIMPDVPMENVLAMMDEARKFRFEGVS